MKILTANRLVDGEVVWLARDRSWAEGIHVADLARDADAEARLEAIGAQAMRDNQVVDANLVDVELVNGAIVPIRLRERIRAAGPTNRRDLGKQARANVTHVAT
ncbi:MAG: DUF2849 domain-containing protein [Rhizobiaceae bacterium]|nr:DUF2849 domain-containing protein [Rhizobiaceae bacterium]